MESSRLKKESVLAMFGSKFGVKLLNWLDPCCTEFCDDTKVCLGISPTGNPNYFLNQQGNFVVGGGGSGNPAGTDRQVQFNNAGVFGADDGFNYIVTGGRGIAFIGTTAMNGIDGAVYTGTLAMANGAGPNLFLQCHDVSMTGDTTWNLPGINAAGVLTNDGTGNISWSPSSSGGSLNTRVFISSAQILTSNSVPVELIPAPGTGKFIQVLQISYTYTFNTTTYNTSGEGGITLGTGGSLMSQVDFSASNNLYSSSFTVAGNEQTQTIENVPLLLTTQGGDPTDGDGTATLYIAYQIVSL